MRPDDDHNRALLKNIHPPDWINPTPAPKYHLVVIGAGTAGLVTAAGAAGLGAKVALIEKHLMGGDCLNYGCVPSKALIRAARAAADARNAGAFGVRTGDVSVDFAAVMERMRRLRAQISPNDSAARFKKLGVDIFIGAGNFTGADTVQVGDHKLRFKKAVIATGARASSPLIPGLSEVPYLTNETLFSLTALPKRFGVLGAGPIGCEMAQSFARFGSEVFLVEALHGILPREDRDAAGIVQAKLARDGVKLLCCGKALKLSKSTPRMTSSPETGIARSMDVERPPEGTPGIRIQVESHGANHDVVVDQLLVAVGRVPNVEGLGLETVGVEFDKKGVNVDDRLRTTNPRIFACGDICSSFQFTHAADFMARIVIQNALFLGRARASALTIPWCTYTDPELAHVGLSETDAKTKNIPIQTFTQELKDVDRAILDGEPEGLVKVHLEAGGGRILGASLVASHAGEMINELTHAMVAGTGISAIAKTIHPYPTQAEAIRKTGDAFNRARLTPGVKKLLMAWLRWTL